jgi:protein involved in ribonucleotide reduction
MFILHLTLFSMSSNTLKFATPLETKKRENKIMSHSMKIETPNNYVYHR